MICAVRTPGRKADTSHPDVGYTLHFQENENREGLVQESWIRRPLRVHLA